MPSDPKQAAFLAQPRVAILATIGPKQCPHAVPVWYLYEAGEFTLTMQRGSQKHRNIERCPNVSLVVDRRDRPYYAVTAMGVAEMGASPTRVFAPSCIGVAHGVRSYLKWARVQICDGTSYIHRHYLCQALRFDDHTQELRNSQPTLKLKA
jgi:PPOX class probable F420-dependent enzyme